MRVGGVLGIVGLLASETLSDFARNRRPFGHGGRMLDKTLPV